MHAPPREASTLYGSGLIADCQGEPLRPGGPALSDALIDAADFGHGGVVIDVGCGQGSSLERLARHGFDPIGIDVAAAAIVVARQATASATVVMAGGDSLPFATASIDGVLAECSLSVMPDRLQALAEWSRVLRPGARLALSDVYIRSPAEGAQLSRGGTADWATLSQEVAAAGLAMTRFEDRSEVLKSWVAHFVFRYGSLDALWACGCGLPAGAFRRSAPGYFLLIATKPDRRDARPVRDGGSHG